MNAIRLAQSATEVELLRLEIQKLTQKLAARRPPSERRPRARPAHERLVIWSHFRLEILGKTQVNQIVNRHDETRGHDRRHVLREEMDQIDARARNRQWQPHLLVPSEVSPASERNEGKLGSHAR